MTSMAAQVLSQKGSARSWILQMSTMEGFVVAGMMQRPLFPRGFQSVLPAPLKAAFSGAIEQDRLTIVENKRRFLLQNTKWKDWRMRFRHL